MGDEYWVSIASTAWRGWDVDTYDFPGGEVPDRCVEVSMRDCSVGTIERIASGDITDLPALATLATDLASEHALPLVWSMQDLCYAEPIDADTLRELAHVRYEARTAICDGCGDRFDAANTIRYVDLDDEGFCSEHCAETRWCAVFNNDEEE